MSSYNTFESSTTPYRTYRTRWVFLLAIALQNAGCFMLSYAYGPVAVNASRYFTVSGDELDIILVVSFFLWMFGYWIGIYLIERFKLLATIRFAAVMSFSGALIRILATLPLYQDALDRRLQFWLVFAGQVVLSLGYPTFTTLCTKTSQVWFPESERPISTATLGLTGLLGGIVGQGIAPVIVGDNDDNVPYLDIAFSVPIALGFVLAWFVIKSGEPPSPPSRSSELLSKKDSDFGGIVGILKKVKVLATDRTTLALGIVQGAGIGFINTLMSQLNQLMCSSNYTVGQSSLAAMLASLSGLIGAFTLGPLAKRHRRQREFGQAGFGVAVLGILGLSISLNYRDIYPAIATFMAVLGCFGISAFPMNLEVIVEHTYPMEASIGEAWTHTWGQVAGITLVILSNNLYNDLPEGLPETCSGLNSPEGVEARDYGPYYYFIMGFATVMGFVIMFVVRPEMNRPEEAEGEEEKTQDNEK